MLRTGKSSSVFKSSTISYYIISLGCSKNLVDSEKINGALMSAGFFSVDTAEEADIVIINTCGFIESAKEESIGVIFDAVSEIEENKNAPGQGGDFSRKIVAAGCLTQRYLDEIKNDVPEIDLVYGVLDDNFIKKLSEEFDIEVNVNFDDLREPLIEGLPYSYIKISEGCSNNCSYCAIPIIRGEWRPYPMPDIISEAEAEAKRGAKEIILIAQDTALYRWEGKDLYDLVDEISRIEGVEWIRLLYFHPDHVNDRLIELLRDNKKVVKYIDLPFQHVSDQVLKSMGRCGDYESYASLVSRLREAVPGIRIRSTFMVGFPGETDSDFKLLIKFLKEVELDRVGAFIYSPEEGTEAVNFQNMVPKNVSNKRYDKLMSLQKKISMKKLQDMENSRVRVIVEGMIDEKTYICRSEFDAPEVDGVFLLDRREYKD